MILVALLALSAPLPDDARVLGDMRFATFFNQSAQEQSLYCDVYQPDVDDAPVSGLSPLVIFAHGGGFDNGDRDLFSVGPNLAAELQAAGYTVAVCDMPIGDDDPDADSSTVTSLETLYGVGLTNATARAAAAGIEAMKAAVRFFRKNRETLSIDMDRIYICGWSSGAITAASAAYCPESSFVDHNNPSFEHEVDGVGVLEGSAELPLDQGWITSTSPVTYILVGDDDVHDLTKYNPFHLDFVTELDANTVSHEDHVIDSVHGAVFEMDVGETAYQQFLGWLDTH